MTSRRAAHLRHDLVCRTAFLYELEKHRISVHNVSARKPIFMDKNVHDWHLVMLVRELGWTGVALKTCKTQTGTLLTLC